MELTRVTKNSYKFFSRLDSKEAPTIGKKKDVTAYGTEKADFLTASWSGEGDNSPRAALADPSNFRSDCYHLSVLTSSSKQSGSILDTSEVAVARQQNPSAES